MAHLDEPQKGACVEVGQVVFLRLNHLQFLLWVIDQRTEFVDFFLVQRGGEQFFHFSLDVSACIAQNVQKRLVLSVYVRHEVFRSFRKVLDGFQVDDFRAGTFNTGESLGQQL